MPSTLAFLTRLIMISRYLLRIAILLKRPPWYLQLVFNIIRKKWKSPYLLRWGFILTRFQYSKGLIITVRLSYDELFSRILKTRVLMFLSDWLPLNFVQDVKAPDIRIKLPISNVSSSELRIRFKYKDYTYDITHKGNLSIPNDFLSNG